MRAGLLPGEKVIRRRGTLEQGQALETLGHAVEYVIDSRMFMAEEGGTDTGQEAVQILMRLSRAVFLDCPEVIPLRRKVAEKIGRWVTQGRGRVRRQSA